MFNGKKNWKKLAFSAMAVCLLVASVPAVPAMAEEDMDRIAQVNQAYLDGLPDVTAGASACWPQDLADKAAEAVGNETDMRKKAKLLYDWMLNRSNFHIAEESGNYQDIQETWEDRGGTCLHYASVYSAMCQSQNIPCTVIGGYFFAPYLEGGREGHAWNAVYDGNQWFWVDPVQGVGSGATFDIPMDVFNRKYKVESIYNKYNPTLKWAIPEIEEAFLNGVFPASLSSKWVAIENPRYETQRGPLVNHFIETCTREDFCSMAVALVEKAMGKSVKAVMEERDLTLGTFSDTDNYDVLCANALGIVNGVGEGKFAPQASLTREQAAVILSRAATAAEQDTSVTKAAPFTDVKQATWSSDGIAWCYQSGVMNGVGNNLFAPAASYTRAQAVVTFNRLFEMITKE